MIDAPLCLAGIGASVFVGLMLAMVRLGRHIERNQPKHRARPGYAQYPLNPKS